MQNEEMNDYSKLKRAMNLMYQEMLETNSGLERKMTDEMAKANDRAFMNPVLDSLAKHEAKMAKIGRLAKDAWNKAGIVRGAPAASSLTIKNTGTLVAYPVPTINFVGATTTVNPDKSVTVDTTGSGGAVTSVFGRTGTVLSANGDYTASQITNVPAGTVAATTVQAAINELDTEKEPSITAGSLNQYYRGDKTFQILDASAVTNTPAGNISATNVQAAINELDTEKAGLAIANTFTAANDFTGGTITVPTPTLAADAVPKAYADSLVAGLLDDRGNYDASSNLFPSTGGSGVAGAILKGDIWFISVPGTLGGTPVIVGSSVRALVDTPGQTSTNWDILDASTTGGVASLSAIGAAPNANGATITGTVINLEPASASFGGVVTTGTQTFAGDKTHQGIQTYQNTQLSQGEILMNNGAQWRSATNTTVAGATTIDFTAFPSYDITLVGNTTLSFTSPALTAGYRKRLELVVRQDATGGRTLTLPASVKKATTDTFVTTASARQNLTLIWNGTDYEASLTGALV